MRKFIFVLSLLFITTVSLSQNKPTLLGFQVDTMCNNDWGVTLVHSVMVEDLDGDVTSIFIDFYDPADFMSVSVDFPTPVGGQTIRTFTFTANAGTGLAPGLNLSDLNITITGNISLDLTATDTVIKDVAIYGDLGIVTTFDSQTLCSNSNPIDIRPYASPAGGSFSWVGQDSYMFDPEIFYAQGGMYIFYYYTNAAGCQDSYMASPPVINVHPNVSMSPGFSTCGNADGMADAFIFGGTAPYDVYWSTGFAESSSSMSSVTNLAAGNYYANITDANGCKAVGLAQISDIEMDVNGNIVTENCQYVGQDGGVDLVISASLGTPNFFYWSNGQTTEDLVGVSKGEYIVEVRTDLGCESNNLFWVDATPYVYVQNFNSIDASCGNSDGIIDYDVLGGVQPYTYLWNTGATSEDLFGVPTGTYSCLVTDVLGCTTNYTHNIYSLSGPGASIVQIIEPTCGMADGAINMDVYSFSSPIISASWSTGQLTEDLTNVPAGDYTLTLMAQDGCTFSHTVSLGNAIPERPEVCMLTVDTSLIYNAVIWEKDLSQPSIAGYKIYRETSTFGVFELIADRPYALESFFQDNDASPIDRSWRYYLTSYDACGNESYPSDVHKTMHIVTNTSNGTDFDISWDEYEGMNYSSVDIFRFDSTNGWMNVGNMPFGTNTFPDAPPVLIGLDYMAQFNLPSPCTSTKAQDHNSSRSNKTASTFEGGGSTAQIIDEELGYISIYPNPVTDLVTLHVDKPESFQSYEITNMNGEIIYTGMIFTNNTLIATDELASGVYMIRLISSDKIIVEKFVKN